MKGKKENRVHAAKALVGKGVLNQKAHQLGVALARQRRKTKREVLLREKPKSLSQQRDRVLLLNGKVHKKERVNHLIGGGAGVDHVTEEIQVKGDHQRGTEEGTTGEVHLEIQEVTWHLCIVCFNTICMLR